MLDAADFDGMLVLLDINGHRVEVMYFETLVGNSVLMLDLMVVICLGSFRLVEDGGWHKLLVIVMVRLLLGQMRLRLRLVIVELVLPIVVYDTGQHGRRTGEQQQRNGGDLCGCVCVGVQVVQCFSQGDYSLPPALFICTYSGFPHHNTNTQRRTHGERETLVREEITHAKLTIMMIKHTHTHIHPTESLSIYLIRAEGVWRVCVCVCVCQGTSACIFVRIEWCAMLHVGGRSSEWYGNCLGAHHINTLWQSSG